MRIFNASASGGAILREGKLILPEMALEDKVRLVHTCDIDLCRTLLDLEIPADRGEVAASLRWFSRKHDAPGLGPRAVAGTFGFHGSGVCFWLTSEENGLRQLSFLEALSWKEIYACEEQPGREAIYQLKSSFKDVATVTITHALQRIKSSTAQAA